MVGSLIYGMTCTRPDLSWAVTKLSQHLEKPLHSDLVMLKHVFRYISGTLDYKLQFTKTKNGLKLIGYCDADWASSAEDRRSTSGYCFALNECGSSISWRSKRQNTVALSSCESEYMALTLASQEAIYLASLLQELLGSSSRETVKIFADNQGAISLTKNPVHHSRSKHIDIKYHYIRENVTNKNIDIVYVPSEHNVADIMTKSLAKVKLRKFVSMLFGFGYTP